MSIKQQRTINILIMIIMSMIYMLPIILKPGIIHFSNQDTIFHLSRIQGLSNVFRSPVNFNNYNHHGTMMNVFYPWQTIYPAYVLYRLTGSLVAGYKLYYLGLTLLTMLLAYFSMLKMKHSDLTALLFSLLYTFATYRSTDIFKRASLGEAVAITFLPLVMLGCYNIMKGDYKKWYVLTIGMTLVLYSHLLSVAMISVYIAIFFLITFYFWDNKILRLKYLVLATISTLITSAGTIIPMLEQFKYTKLKVPEGSQLSGVPIMQLISNSLTSNIFSYGIGLILLIGIFWTTASILVKQNKLNNIDKLIFSVGAVTFIMMASFIPWHYFNHTPIVSLQFVFRIASFAQLFIAYGFSIALTPKNDNFNTVLAKTIVTIATLIIIHCVSMNNLYKSETNHQTTIPRETIIQQSADYDHTDYANIEILGHTEVSKQLFILNDTHNISVNNNWTDSIYTININNGLNSDARLSMPIYRYKGQIITVNGERKSTHLSKFGTTEVYIPKGNSNIRVTYRYTKIATIFHIISLISVLCLAIYSIYYSFFVDISR